MQIQPKSEEKTQPNVVNSIIPKPQGSSSTYNSSNANSIMSSPPTKAQEMKASGFAANIIPSNPSSGLQGSSTSRGQSNGNPTHSSILSANGLLSLASKIDAAKIGGPSSSNNGSMKTSIQMQSQQQAQNIKNGAKPPKQHPILRKPGVFIASLTQPTQEGIPLPLHMVGAPGSNPAGNTNTRTGGLGPMEGLLQGSISLTGGSHNTNNTSNSLLNSTGNYMSNFINTKQQSNKKEQPSPGFIAQANSSSTGFNLNAGQTNQQSKINSNIDGFQQDDIIERVVGFERTPNQQQFLIQPNFNVPTTLLPNAVVMENDNGSTTFDTDALRQNIFLTNKLHFGRQQFNGGGSMKLRGPGGLSLMGAPNGSQGIGCKNEFLYNYNQPSQQYQPVVGHQNYRNYQSFKQHGSKHQSHHSESPAKFFSNSMGSGGLKQTGFNNPMGGHLFSYNEIREHKKNLAQSLKKQTNKFLSEQNTSYVVPDVNFLGHVQFQPPNIQQIQASQQANNENFASGNNSQQWDANNQESGPGNKYYVQSALVIQNFVFNLPPDELRKGKTTTSSGGGVGGTQYSQGRSGQGDGGPQQQYADPMTQQQIQLYQLQRQFQQQFGHQPQSNQQLLQYQQYQKAAGNYMLVPLNQALQNQSQFIDLGLNGPFAGNSNSSNTSTQGATTNNRSKLSPNSKLKAQQAPYGAEEVLVFVPTAAFSGQSPQDQRDNVFRMFMGNEHRYRIKQIYAQQGKILQDTLAQGAASSQQQLLRDAYDMYYSNQNNPEGAQYMQHQNTQLFQQDAAFLAGTNNNGMSTSFDRRRRASASNNKNPIGSNSYAPTQFYQNGNELLMIDDMDPNNGYIFQANPSARNGGLWAPPQHYQVYDPMLIGESPLYSRGNSVKRNYGPTGLAPIPRFLKMQSMGEAASDDQTTEGAPEDQQAAYGGINPSALRKQYCSSQKQGERVLKRKTSTTETSAVLTNRRVRNAGQLDEGSQEEDNNNDGGSNLQGYSSTSQTNKTIGGIRRNGTQQPIKNGTAGSQKNGWRNNISSSKSKNDLQSAGSVQNLPSKSQINNLQVKDAIPEKDKEGEDGMSVIDENEKNNEQTVNPTPTTTMNTVVIRAPKRIVNPYDEFLKEQEKILQARKEAKEKYTKISTTLGQSKKTQPLKFIIKEGNNHWLIQKIMNLRVASGAWEETTNYDSLYNFKWQPVSFGIKYDQISTYGCKQLVNHIEGHENLTTKDMLFINMRTYCEKASPQLNVFELLPLTFIIDFKSETLYEQCETFRGVMKLLDANINLDTNEINKKLMNFQTATERKAALNLKNPYKLMQSAHDHKNIWLLKPTGLNRGRGIHIFQTLDELRQILIDNYDIQWFGFSGSAITGPTNNTKSATTSSNATTTNSVLVSSSNANQNQSSPNKEAESDEAGLPQIQEVSTAQKPQENQSEAKQQQVQAKLRSFSFVVQKYIEKPILFKNRKFDIRVWVFISFDYKCYLFKECYVRTSCEDYDLGQNNLDKIYVHLTNNAIQKYSDNYGKFEDGNQISLQELSDYLASTGSSGMSGTEIKDKFNQQHRDLIIHSLKAIKGKLKIRKYTFELVGYDFIIDEDLQSYIIEVNTNPCIEESSNLLKMLVPRMLDDMFKLTVDTVFNQNGANNNSNSAANGEVGKQNAARSPYSVTGYEDNVNMWEPIFTFQ